MGQKSKNVLTLCLVHQHPRILLGMKKRGFGEGRWNGFGGKVEAGESIKAAAHRELKEECGIEADVLERAGVLEFAWEGKPEKLEVHVFRVTSFAGEPAETEEMRPQWFYMDEIPFGQMWSDDIHWFPYFLSGRSFEGRFVFNEADRLLEGEVKEV